MRFFIASWLFLAACGTTNAFAPLSTQPKLSPWGGLVTDSPASDTTKNKQEGPRLSLPFQTRQSAHRISFVPSSLLATSSETSDRDPIRLIIAGAPASGKGTQCEKIKTKYGLVHLSTGDMLREAVAAGTTVGKKAKEFMDSGRLVPDEVIIGVIKDRLDQDDCKSQGWLLDGFPRTQAQAKALEECGAVADCFIFLNVPDEILVERVVGRRTDPDTGAIYHMVFSPPDDEDVLKRLVQRSDDTEEKVKVRLEQFHANVGAVSASYEAISVTIDGNQAPAIVTDAIFEAVEQRISQKLAA